MNIKLSSVLFLIIFIFPLPSFAFQKLLKDNSLLPLVKPKTESYLVSQTFNSIEFERVEEGRQKYAEKDYRSAIKIFTEAIGLNPNYFLAYYSRAKVYKDTKNFSEALEDLNQAIRLNPNLELAYYEQAIIYKELKDYPKALEKINQAISINSYYGDAYFEREEIKEKLGIELDVLNRPNDVDVGFAAIDILDKDIEPIGPFPFVFKNPNHSHEQAMQELKNNNYQKAIEYLTELITVNSPSYYSSFFYVKRGNAYLSLKKYSDALNDFEKSIQIFPYYSVAYLQRITTFLELKDYSKAVENFEQYLLFNPDGVKNHYYLGRVYHKELKNLSKAMENYNAAIYFNPNFAEGYFWRGKIYAELSQKEKALKNWQKAAKLFQEQGKKSEYQETLKLIKKIQ